MLASTLADLDLPTLAFGIIGIVFVIYPLGAVWKRRCQNRRRSEWTTGQVVDEAIQTSANYNGPRHKTRHPVVAYEVDGQSYEVTSETGASWQILAPGDAVTVAYNPHDPGDAGVEDESLKMVESAIFTILPLVGIFLIYRSVAGL